MGLVLHEERVENMTVNWDGYQPFDPAVAGPLGSLPRRDARAAFDRLMAAKSARIAEVCALLERNGQLLAPDPSSLQAVNDWFRRDVEPDPARRDRLRPLWYAVVNDLALFLGDAITARAPGLRPVGSKSCQFGGNRSMMGRLVFQRSPTRHRGSLR